METSQLAASNMSTATLNGGFNAAPDTTSPVYPDRLIRPLPKRPLRSRLSIDAADSVPSPPAPPAARLFQGVPTDHEDVGGDSKVYVQQTVEQDTQDQYTEQELHYSYENSVDFDSADEDSPVMVRRSAGFRGSSLPLSASTSSHPQIPNNGGRPRQAKSSSTGPDGYDAFENTNNKKKRKIPTPGNLSGHHSSLSPEFSAMGLVTSAPSTPVTAGDNGVSAYYTAGNSSSPGGNGISGSGRGRLGRQSAPRSSSGRPPLSVQTQVGLENGDSPGKPDQGIISAAIANAAAVSSSPRGPNNGSLLDQDTTTTTPTKTQFTFTCESDSSKGMALQAQNSYPIRYRSPTSPLAAMGQNARGFYTQGTQTSPSMAAQQGYAQAQQQVHETPTGGPANPGRKKKRSPGSIYALSARQRKIQQQYANLHHPPSMGDIWICEFCEYESIFGRPPEALIRQYEIKDRKERKRLAEKKRLLEKAKMKGRKNRKATKNASKQQTASHHPGYQPGYDRASVDHSSVGDGHEDDYNEYDGDEHEPAPGPGPPLASFRPPLPPGNKSKTIATPPVSKSAIDMETNRPP